MKEWVVLQLSSRGDQEDPDLVRNAIAHTLKGADIFIPAAVTQVGDDRVIHYLLEGYAFVRLDRPTQDYFKLEGTRYVQNVLVKPGAGSRQRRVSTVSDRDIVRMRDQIRQLTDQGIGVGDVVRITSGPYRNMQAIVVEEIPEVGQVQVYIKLRSKQSLITLPRSFLVVVERAPMSAFNSRLSSLYEWTLQAKPLFDWTSTLEPLEAAYQTFERVDRWVQKGSELYSLLTFDKAFEVPLKELKTKLDRLAQVSYWHDQGSLLYTFVSSYSGNFLEERVLQALADKADKIAWVENKIERIRLLWDEVDLLSRSLARRHEGKTMVQNVLIDGHNLAFRCLYAPGMSNLTDKKGRPTGMILGFLNSLGAIRKKFPEAIIHVAWDGSSRRRKAKFGEYKANRQPHTATDFDPMAVLKRVLPLLGVRQIWNPEEEADDVIATLVHGDLKDQVNIIFSTDRDFLQLVTKTTSLLVPSVGSRNEILFNPDTVVESVGVPPEKVVQLRAFYGDDSDNIPGVPRVPKKVLKSLVQAHGSVAAVYRSGLVGLTKGQYERLRGAEPQVRINVDLMTLVDVSVSATLPDVDPDSVTKELQGYDINPKSLLETFFGRPDS